MTIGIYTIKNLINGKIYVGQSINIEKRWYEHKYKAVCESDISYNSAIHSAFRHYGVDKFEFNIVEECSYDTLDSLETSYISKLNTLSPRGYNIQTGGQSTRRIPTYCVDCGTVIAKDSIRCVHCFGVSSRKASRPEKDELLTLIYDNGFEHVARLYGVSSNAIRYWCTKYGLPRNYSNIVQLVNPTQIKKPEVKRGPIYQVDPETHHIIGVYESAVDIRKKLGLNNKMIRKAITGKLKTAYGYVWRY